MQARHYTVFWLLGIVATAGAIYLIDHADFDPTIAPPPNPGEVVLDPHGPAFVITPIRMQDGTRCVVARRMAVAIACDFPPEPVRAVPPSHHNEEAHPLRKVS